MLAQFATKLRVSEVTAVNGKVLWELGAQLASHSIVRGFAKVKNAASMDAPLCNGRPSGAATLSGALPVQERSFFLLFVTPPPLNLDFRYVETYIKAFYTPESEIVRWTMIHPGIRVNKNWCWYHTSRLQMVIETKIGLLVTNSEFRFSVIL